MLAEVERLPRAPQGRPLKFSDADALEIMFKVLRTGMQWREVVAPVCYTTVFRRFQTWHLRGIFRDAYKKVLQTHAKLQRPRFYCVDSSYVRNRHCQVGTGRNHTDRGRQALKLSVLTDDGGVVHAARLDAGNRPDVCLLGATLAAALVRLDRLPLYADRGYDSRNNRGLCSAAGLQDRIFRRKTKTCRRTNARRIVVEHTFAWLQRYRRLLFCYEQSPGPYLSFVLLGLGDRVGRQLQRAQERGGRGGGGEGPEKKIVLDSAAHFLDADNSAMTCIG